MWQKKLHWEKARDLCSSPRCTINSNLKPFIISPKPYGHPGLPLQLQIRRGHGALNVQGHQNSKDPKSNLLPPGSILVQGLPSRYVILTLSEYELKKHSSPHVK